MQRLVLRALAPTSGKSLEMDGICFVLLYRSPVDFPLAADFLEDFPVLYSARLWPTRLAAMQIFFLQVALGEPLLWPRLLLCKQLTSCQGDGGPDRFGGIFTPQLPYLLMIIVLQTL